MTYRVFVVRVFENLMSRNDKLKVGSSQWPERDMFLSRMGCISLITMKQIKSYVFLAIFDQCPILTCPGMTNYHDILDLDKTCCVNCTELHSSLLTIISTFSHCPLPDQISYLRWFPKLELIVKRSITTTMDRL